ncbi:SurA N-terminal domain-containing protein [Shewanella sp. SW36]|jgi:peptidyl-prolyl cis-trans isomerase D|uniref:Periplasmic chaperone PpiD n=1 Tax=Shewanella oncorhynchi TaxID=2726434 RepID=A0AA50Q593_9GAMM|nr:MULTISPECIES: SurA N-terminal domain-containing protein [Shewanella]AVI68539.1 peptidylprolyl isomerase [Shewanella sp. WE21]MBP7663835.1 SurA N-terminal domain-containing protein [Shewanella sp.]MBW3529695.1 SurA N-terminal domain-containing protein [Shewanella sp. NKUCC06_TVS]MCU7962866.1 SurA N-terminal domain-containing protein [Shewanella sp. SW32]MCU7970762.1 SurA N-terminal domain-containing protein [Shewanella sp. SW29]
MLEKIRDGSQGVIAKGILVLVILSFAFAGVSSYLGSTTDVPAAEVNGDKITKAELEQAYQSERSRMEQQLGEMFAALSADEKYLQSIKQSVLERLVADKLIDQAAKAMGLRVSDEQIVAAMRAEPAFQTDGKFDNDRYQAILRQLGYQPQTFRDMMRVDMTRRQLTAALVGTEFVLPGEAKQLAELQGQTRDVRYVIVDSAPFLATAVVTDEQVKNYYDANQGQFMSPEMVSLEYVELNAADFAKNNPVSDEEAQTYYEEHKAQYVSNEKRLAAHILVMPGNDEAAAKAKAEDLAKQLDSGADFADLAKANSDDTLSAEQGGKLDWFEPGVMDPAFDAALFALNKGQHSAVVKTDFGFHIIKLLDVQSGATVPFADVKAKIVAQLQDKKAVDQFYSLQSKLADTSYEVPDTLSETAKAVGVDVKTTALFSRDNAPAELNKPDLVKAAFSETVMLKGLNSEVIELEPNHVVVIRVKEHHDAGTLALAEVKANITERLKQDQANEAARAKAQELMAQVKAGATDLGLVSKAKLGRGAQDVDAAIVGKAFQMPTPSTTPVVDTVGLANGYAVVALDKVNAAEGVSDELVNALKQRLNAQYSEADYRGLIDSLKANAKVLYPVEE